MFKIMLVDDEKLERDVLTYLVEKNCPDLQVVGQTGNGLEAISLANELQPDIIFLDIKMPTINGLEVAKKIKNKLKKVKIVITTAYEEFSFAQEAVKIGVTDYLLKPVRPKEIIRILQTLKKEIEQENSRSLEEQRLKQRLAMVMPFLKVGFLNDLLAGRIESAKELEERASFLNFRLLASAVMVIHIDKFLKVTSNQPELNRQLLKKQIFKIIKKSAKSLPTTLTAPIGGNRFVAVYSPEEQDTEQIRSNILKLGEKIRSLIKAETPATVSLGIGHYYPEPIDICLSYQEALKALNNRYFIGNNQVIHIQDLEHYHRSAFPYSYRKERHFLEKVRTGNNEETKEALLELLEKCIIPYSNSLETLRSSIAELLVVLSRTLAEIGGDSQDFSAFAYVQQLSNLNNVEEITKWLLELVDEALEQNKQTKQDLSNQVVTTAEKYLKENFHRNISLEDISNYVHLSPFYFSRIFKKETGLNFIEFLTKLRIEEAKKLLVTSDEPVVNIANLVGYNEPNYFSRVFRKLVGMTPKQYKNLNLNYKR